MDHSDWDTIRPLVEDSFYADLVGTVGCGPFDGGCVLVARVLARIFGGEVVVLMDVAGVAQHAVVLDCGSMLDYAGSASPTSKIAQFNFDERSACVAYRHIAPEDLSDACSDAALEERLEGLVRDRLLELSSAGPSRR